MSSVLLYSGLDPQVVHIQGAAAGSASAYLDGDLVQTDGNGELVIAGNRLITGVAREDFSTTDDTDTPVDLIDFSSIYVGKVATGTTTSEAYIGDGLAFTFTVGAHTLAVGGATDDVYCVGLHPVDWELAGGRILFRFNYNCFKETT